MWVLEFNVMCVTLLRIRAFPLFEPFFQVSNHVPCSLTSYCILPYAIQIPPKYLGKFQFHTESNKLLYVSPGESSVFQPFFLKSRNFGRLDLPEKKIICCVCYSQSIVDSTLKQSTGFCWPQCTHR